ncbi:MAG: hypothetical protein L6R42_005147 [Xanthoria sp. 1 TBL-2021]|nr:MAG: hypothetical protein L6R42_005147 [Xanthoria sp. 1 TBL-2021]
MPSNPKAAKRRRSSSAGGGEDYESDKGFVADAPKSKKPKTAAASARAPVKSTKPTNSNNGDDEEFWEITSNRRVNISEFKGQRMVNIREYYEDKSSGAMLPGKKGITLPLAQYSTFVTLLPGIEAALVAKGESVARPDYSTAQSSEKPPNVEDEDAGEEEEGNGDGGKRKNFEATSEEDE